MNDLSDILIDILRSLTIMSPTFRLHLKYLSSDFQFPLYFQLNLENCDFLLIIFIYSVFTVIILSKT